jgi:NACalpha-BTF3-like transcription factor
MKRKWLLPAVAVAVLLFLWTAREDFEDTALVHGPPYGNTATKATQLINMMSPEMLKSIKAKMGVTSETLTDMEKVKIVYGDGTNNSPVAQVMSNFYWDVYKPATVTIDLTAVNKFLGTQTDTWVNANIPDVRDFLKRYFVQGQNGAAQSGYGDIMNTVFGGGVKAQKPAEAKPATTTTEKTKDPGTNWIVVGALAVAGFSVLAVVIVFFLPARV